MLGPPHWRGVPGCLFGQGGVPASAPALVGARGGFWGSRHGHYCAFFLASAVRVCRHLGVRLQLFGARSIHGVLSTPKLMILQLLLKEKKYLWRSQ